MQQLLIEKLVAPSCSKHLLTGSHADSSWGCYSWVTTCPFLLTCALAGLPLEEEPGFLL